MEQTLIDRKNLWVSDIQAWDIARVSDCALSEVYLMDCIAGMKHYPDKFFDLAVVDPPYGIGVDGQKLSVCKNPKHNRKEHTQKDWDSEIPAMKYFTELFRVSKHQIIWGANYFVEHLNYGSKGWIVWFKGQQGLTMSDAELAYSNFDKPTRVATINRVELLKDGTIHPTQKPVKLYDWVFEHYAERGQRVLDTHLGSGSSRIAANKAGLDFVGFEIDEDYFNASEDRFKKFVSQTRLF